MMMDDDVICEPEGVIRAVTFGDLARRPTIVGGHMFSIYARTRLHSFGEIITPWRFWWLSAPGVFGDWDFGARNLRSTRWLHKRIDVDFNGWFMCLIPRQVLDEIGLSLPLFIKWDDSEFGLRAKEAGYPTVTMPGAAVWHIPWTDKNDALDWQAYFHLRNRFVAALLHSAYERGGRMVRESLNHQVAHLVSMQYSTVELRLMALEDVLEGPYALHDKLPTRLAEVNAFRKQFTDAQLQADPDAFPPVRRHKPPRKGKDDSGVPGRASTARPGRDDAAAPAQVGATDLAAAPRGGDPGHGRQVVPHRALRLGRRLDARRQLGRALRARPREVPRPDEAHRGDPRAVPAGVAAAGRRVPRGARRHHLAGGVGEDLRAVDDDAGHPARSSGDGADVCMSGLLTSGTPASRRPTREELEAMPLAPPAATGLGEVVRRRYLLRMLVRNTIQSRYQGTVLGWLWSYLQPAIRFCLFYFLFQVMIGRGAGMENFAVHLFAGMVIVHFFTETFNGGTQSLIQNRTLITKLPVPREMFPVSRMLVAGWHTVPMLVILLFVCVLLGWRPTRSGVAAALLGFILTALLGLSLGLVFSVANVFMRDFGKVAQTLTQFVTFSVPMMYPYTLVQDRFGEPIASYYLYNPMAEAVLLIQRGFWTGTTSDPAYTEALHLPDHLFTRGLIMTLIALVVRGARAAAVLASRVAGPGASLMTTMIQVENATKSFTMSYHRSLKQIALAKARGRKTHDVFNAVDDVSFTVQEGESIGLMGLNGSGKSTLLKLISGVMRPDSGSVLTRGRIAGLIATGAGFDPQLTGRDNLYLNAAILGMSRAETERKFDEIVDFADLGKFLDTEVAYYSLGHEGPPRLRGGDQRRRRHLHRRRGAGGGGPALQAQVQEAHGRDREVRRDDVLRLARARARCATCAAACSCSTTASSPSTVTSTRASRSCTTTTRRRGARQEPRRGRRPGRRHLTPPPPSPAPRLHADPVAPDGAA